MTRLQKRARHDDPLGPARGVELHILGNEGVLFDPSAQVLYRLNGTAACIWCHLERETDQAVIAEATAQSLGISREDAARYVHDTVDRWRSLGLLAGSRLPMQSRVRSQRQWAWRATAGQRETSFGAPSAAGQAYRLLDTIISIVFSDRTLESLARPILRHLEVASTGRADIVLEVARPGRCELRGDGTVLIACDAPQKFAPLLEGFLVQLAVGRYRYFIALHAAAVAAPEGCMLLPGPSGSGKTTLAAGLIGAGWRYMSDDIVLLEDHALNAVPVPESLCIKEEAWGAMSRRWPGLTELVPHLRHDAKRARYLAPPGPNPPPNETGFPVRWIVFPRYSRTATTALRPLSPAESLQRLATLFSGLREALTSERVRRLVVWAAGIDCFEMDVSDLDLAVSRLCALTALDREKR